MRILQTIRLSIETRPLGRMREDSCQVLKMHLRTVQKRPRDDPWSIMGCRVCQYNFSTSHVSKLVQPNHRISDSAEDSASFVDFLHLMRRLLDVNFAGIAELSWMPKKC